MQPPVTGAIAFAVDDGRLGDAGELQIIPEGDVRDGYFERQFWQLPEADGAESRVDIGDSAEFIAALDPEVSYSTGAEPDDDFRAAACD